MELYTLDHDINIMCVQARSFPDGIQEAFHTLHKIIQESTETKERTLFGISHGTKVGGILYKAAASEVFRGEGNNLGIESLTIIKGTYLTEKITVWKTNEASIGIAFGKLIQDPRLDTNYPCIEWYTGDDVLCMVKIIETSSH